MIRDLLRPQCCRKIAYLVLPLALSSFVQGQNPLLRTRTGDRFPTVVFSSVSWTANPPYYSIAIDSTGTATYQSAPDQVTTTGVPYTLEFNVSDRTRRTIFNLTRELGFFVEQVQPAVNSAENGSVVHTLAYKSFDFHSQMTYGPTSDGDLEELTSVFEETSETLEFGRRISYFHHRDKKALARELDGLLEQQRRRALRELHAIDPTLRQIASDSDLDKDIRQKAETLLNAPLRP